MCLHRSALARQESRQAWPEANLYIRLNNTYRVRLVANLAREKETWNVTEGTFEFDLVVD